MYFYIKNIKQTIYICVIMALFCPQKWILQLNLNMVKGCQHYLSLKKFYTKKEILWSWFKREKMKRIWYIFLHLWHFFVKSNISSFKKNLRLNKAIIILNSLLLLMIIFIHVIPSSCFEFFFTFQLFLYIALSF